MRWLFSIYLALGLGACGEEDIRDKLVEADDVPSILGAKADTMLPAHKTAGELEAQIKADGWDPRDQHPSYAFTAAPSDVSRLPSEAEPAQALLVGWPGGASGLTSFFAKMIAAGATEVPKTVVYVSSSTLASQLLSALNSHGADTDNVYFVNLSLDTIWMRDYGPLMVKTKTGGKRIIDLRYYYGRWNDDVAPTKLASAWSLPVSRPPLEAEGGNFQSDGAGSCITTTWMVEQNSGWGYTAQDVRSILKSYLGCQTTVILPTLDGEGTGHVDMYVTITGPKAALVGKYATSDDPVNAQIANQAATMLANAGFTVTRIPMPTNYDGVFRSYTNSLAIGGKVLVPVYSDDRRYESQALSVFRAAYPGRTIVPIDSTAIIQWAGAIHCVTMTIGS
jgi:agmatine/peptidylarginine deiminase